MSDELCDEWWVMKIEWRKLSDEKTLSKQALSLLRAKSINNLVIYIAVVYLKKVLVGMVLLLKEEEKKKKKKSVWHLDVT